MKQRKIGKLLIVLTSAVLLSACGGGKNADNGNADKSGSKIVETGELSAIDSRSFIMPRFNQMWFLPKIIGLLKHGTVVKAGDSIIQIDPADVKKIIVERQSQLETQMAVIAKLKVDQSNKEQELASQLKSETATFDLRKLELEASRFESDRILKIKKLEFEQAKIEYLKVVKQIKVNKIIRFNDMKIELLKADQMKTDLLNAKNVLPRLTVRTPISGIFQVGTNRRTDDLIKLGDEVYPGNNMGNVPDLTWMKVNSNVGERDFMKVRKGQKVIVRMDALPKIKFEGEVSYIGRLCHLKDEKSKQKVFDVEIKMLKSDERLKPGMTVSCEYIL
jgi:multidrug efflux pump subunit AcrA (membrane-fusion protein)